MTSLDSPPQKPPRPDGSAAAAGAGGAGGGGVRRQNSIPTRLSKDDSNIDTNNNNDDDEDDELPQPPAPKGVFARLRDKFASTFELGSLGSQQGNGVPQVVSRNGGARPTRSCIRGANGGAVRSTGTLRFEQSCVVYFFNNDEETNVLVETRRDIVIGRRLRFQTESSVETMAQADAQSAVPSLTSSDTTQLPPRKIIQRRVQVDARSPPPPIFLTQANIASNSASDSSSTTTATTTTTTTATTTTTTAPAVELPRLKSPPPTLPSLLDREDGAPLSGRDSEGDDDNNDDDDDDDESPPPLQMSPRSATKSVAVKSPRSPRGGGGGGGTDNSVAASAPSRFGDTGEWLSSNPVRPIQPSLNLAKHREDGSLDRRGEPVSPRAVSMSPEVSPKKSSHKHKHKSSSKPAEELDAVIAIVDDHETRRQRKAVEN